MTAVIIACAIYLSKVPSSQIPDTELERYIQDLIDSADPRDEGKGRWTQSIRIDDPRGDCNIYNTLTANTQIVDSLQPIPLDAFPNPCANGFNMALSKVERTCIADQCLTKDGRMVTRDAVDVYYEECEKLPVCSNIAQVISANFIRDRELISSASKCLITNSQNQALTTTCRNVGTQESVFQVDRLSSRLQIPFFNELFNQSPDWKDFGENELNAWVNSFEGKTAQNIPVELIRIMKTGDYRCLAPDTISATGTDLAFVPCSELPDNGFIWVDTLTTSSYSSSVNFGGQLILAADLVTDPVTRSRWLFDNLNAYSTTYTPGTGNFVDAVPFRCYNPIGQRWSSPPCEFTELSRTHARQLTSQANGALRGLPAYKYPTDPTILRWTINHFSNRTYPRSYGDLRGEALQTYPNWLASNPIQGRIRGIDLSVSPAKLSPVAPCSTVIQGWGGDSVAYCNANRFITPQEFAELV